MVDTGISFLTGTVPVSHLLIAPLFTNMGERLRILPRVPQGTRYRPPLKKSL